MSESTGNRCFSYGLLGRFVVGAFVFIPLISVGVVLWFILQRDIILVMNLLQLGVFLLISPAAYFLYPVSFCLRGSRLEIRYLLGGRTSFALKDLNVRRGLGGGVSLNASSKGWRSRLMGSFRISARYLEGGSELVRALEQRSSPREG